MNQSDIKSMLPPNCGWLDYRLTDGELNYLWRCINNRKENYKDKLAGNISSSYALRDTGDWFWTHVIRPLIKKYEDQFKSLGEDLPFSARHKYVMRGFWVNYQKQHEFNPIHHHDGVYSFVIWLKIPTDAGYKKQNKRKINAESNSPLAGAFQFEYINTLGTIEHWHEELEPEDEGRMLFFPAHLRHQVYPFYNCDEDRISISGNVSLDTTRVG